MPQPYNYSLNVPNPAQALQQGLQTGVGLGEVRAQADLRNAQTAALQAKAQRTQQFQAALAGLGGNPSAKQISGLLVQYPEMSDLLKEGYTRLSGEEQKERISQASSVYTAALAGDTSLAVKQLNEYAAAYRNSGREDEAKALETNAKLLESHPEIAEKGAALWLAQQMGPEKFEATFGQLQNQRRDTALEKSGLTKAEADAQKAVVASKWAESEAVQKFNLNEEQLRTLAADREFKRENLKIATLNAQLAKESNVLKKQELQGKIDDANIAREQKLSDRLSLARRGASKIDSFINSLDQALATPLGVVEDVTGTIDSQTPTFGEDEAAFEEQIETLGSKSFLTMIESLRGTGPISNIEGEKAQKAFSNLSTRQGRKALFRNLKEGREALLKMRGELSAQYNVDLGTPDTPAAAQDADSSDINALVRGALGAPRSTAPSASGETLPPALPGER